MTVAAVLLAAGGGSRFSGSTHKLRAELDGVPVLQWSLQAMLGADFDEYVVVVGDDGFADLLGDEVTVVPCTVWAEGQSQSLRAAVAHAVERGHESIVVGIADQPLVESAAWRLVAEADATPIAVASYAGQQRPPVRLDASIWPQLPASGDIGARALVRGQPDLVTVVAVPGGPDDIDTSVALEQVQQKLDDRAAVTQLLGRRPQGRFEVAVRDDCGMPIVLRNHPVLDDGRPMPTLYWLCGQRQQILVGRLESMKGVQRAERELGLDVITKAHDRYRAERDAILDAAEVEPVHRPTGGVGGTRRGVKCLHAHYAWWLAGGTDPVGQWVADHLHEVDHPDWPGPRTDG